VRPEEVLLREATEVVLPEEGLATEVERDLMLPVVGIKALPPNK
jgi:hypothetical protein